MTLSKAQIDTRQYLVDELQKDLVGPATPDEELVDRPTVHYLAGILFPRDSAVDAEQDDDAAAASDEDDDVDPGTLMATALNPTSQGMTFVVRKGESVEVRVRVAKYTELPEVGSGKRSIWQRHGLQVAPVTLDEEDGIREYRLTDGLRLYVKFRVREAYNIVTVSIDNDFELPERSPDFDAHCFFQPQIEVTSAYKNRPIFLPREASSSHISPDCDQQLNALLYRHAVEFAVGHGCAVTWEIAEDGNATIIRTVTVPALELLQLSPDRAPFLRAHSMKFLSEAPPRELVEALRATVQQYRDWIGQQQAKLPAVLEPHRETGRKNLEICAGTVNRMEQAVEMIAGRDNVRRAFQLANRAMLIQRSRVEWLKVPIEQRPPVPSASEKHRWRHFQLAFILLCLASIADPSDPARQTVDLLWFPTGGGKTEAYLGLTAFTIFLRRLRNIGRPEGAGVTVIMRYTLRLLTIQQFQRAASLIMACETLRRGEPEKLGQDTISLGLWVGAGATPNSLADAAEALKQLRAGDRVYEGNPYQVLSCPWCGTKLTPLNYSVANTLKISCPSKNCDFSGGLPLYLVDDDIYNVRPSLLLGTVDKFARLPWKAETAALFGRTKDKPGMPPELIIQDELHLISGPLGTMVGLYEVAVDTLCRKNQQEMPKVIASTATIRRASEQCIGLFNRGLCQFPPPGLDARDSFFAQEAPPLEKPGRMFVGVYAPGRSMKTALLRIYALLLQKIHEHHSPPDNRDPYWTLIGYFNSMRELGGAERLVDDDVRARIKVLTGRSGKPARAIDRRRELNSRVYSDEIPGILDEMALPIDSGRSIDVLLATNMISVGVDVDRLGLMVVTGQPKMTSEYIQATSRVGRVYPGLVVTLYNWSRPRDRSHYERFIAYHSALYSHVEATSVTPFASRARDRGLHAVFIAMVRHMVSNMNLDNAAGTFDSDNIMVDFIRKAILERVKQVDPDELPNTTLELESIINHWTDLCGDTLRYAQSLRSPDSPHLLEPAETFVEGSQAYPTLNSLRGVEGESGLFFKRM